MSINPESFSKLIPLWASNQDLFIQAMEAMPLGVLITNLEGRVIYCNDAQSRIDDMKKDFIIGKLENELYGPYLGPGIMRTCQETGQPILGFVCHYRTVHGKIINGAYWVFPIKYKGEICGSLCMTQLLKNKLPMFPPADEDSLEDQDPTSSSADESGLLTIVGADPAFRRALSVAQTTSTSPSPVLISGETGTGKEMFVRAIRKSGNRHDKPYQAINCSAIPATLLEGILFGATRGSFTGAVDRPGLFEEADHGIIYLDEIDSMPMELQPKLLRVIQEMRVRRLGSSMERPLDVKIISSIGATPDEVLASGRMRPDLYYRLAVISVIVPPLRERMGDLDDLIAHFITKYNKLLDKNITHIDAQLLSLFRRYDWPGNVRELEYVIAGAINLTAWENALHMHHIPDHHRLSLEGRVKGARPSHFGPHHRPLETPPAQTQSAPARDSGEISAMSLSSREAETLAEALRAACGSVSRASEILGISRQLLSYKMKKHGLSRHDFKNK
ncbi:sigma 54-interacting transcriptional regulator [Deltaproteobacteria bacterium OttesenSCG-928-K17]|nr:sigma 54-interacting transcriptional regulator [Deltaproteobacteria bacterium OttesenSCG-928-K17]